MIDKKELRLGNYIRYNGNGFPKGSGCIYEKGVNYEVNEDMLFALIVNKSISLKDFEPIELTDELVETIREFNDVYIFKTHNSYAVTQNDRYTAVNYLHELQNICYYLFDKEIKLK